MLAVRSGQWVFVVRRACQWADAGDREPESVGRCLNGPVIAGTSRSRTSLTVGRHDEYSTRIGIEQPAAYLRSASHACHTASRQRDDSAASHLSQSVAAWGQHRRQADSRFGAQLSSVAAAPADRKSW